MQNYLKGLTFFTLVYLASGSPTSRKLGYGPGEQDWGWIDVRKGAHMFYWLYYTTANVSLPEYKPLVIWLQGGPGSSSSSYGNFAEIGTLHINGSTRKYAWTKEVNLLFIDNPVGTGFSYVDDLSYLTKTNYEIGKDMVNFLIEFYGLFPNFRKTPLYIFSESYGGKMAVEIGKQLYDKIKFNEIAANFKGVALIDAWISPIDSVNGWAPFLLYTGIIDQRSYNKLTAGAKKVQKAIDEGRWLNATTLWGRLEMDIHTETSGVDFYNILTKISKNSNRAGELIKISPMGHLLRSQTLFSEENELSKLMNGPVRRTLNIPAKIVHGAQKPSVFNTLNEDFMKPVMNTVTHLLDKTPIEVVVISGQLDLIVETYGTLHWVDNLKYSGSAKWANAKRMPFVVNGIIEGYVTKADNLSFYWVNRAGHMVPKDNPEASMAILKTVCRI